MTERSQGRRVGRYVVRRRLGAGGFARVYLGFDPDLEFEVAIKVLKAQFADDPDAVERFRREATTAVRLRHPNVVTVLTVGRLEEEYDGSPLGAPYLVMDYLPDSLSGRLAEHPVLPEEEVRRVGAEVARGLAYAHQAGVVHRDVKPDNILFGRDGQAVVTDFGIARAVADTLSPVTRSAVVGTPSYFSPEQARGLPLDGRTDIYALGVTLYQAATGALPFTGDDWYAVMRQHVEDRPPPPSGRNPALSSELDAIILRCLAKDPNDRFTSATELAEALVPTARVVTASVPALESRETHATVVVAPYEARRASTMLGWKGARTTRRWLVAGVVLGGLVAGGVLALVINAAAVDRASPPAPPTAADSSLAGSLALPPNPVVPGATFGTPTTIVPRPESVPQAPRTGTLTVSAPGAEIQVDGRPVGQGSWSDTLAPRMHQVRARVASGITPCPSADTIAPVTVFAGGSSQLKLRPRPCGALNVVPQPGPAQFTLRPYDGGPEIRGVFPSPRPQVVPAGRYRLKVWVPNCSSYDDDVTIAPGATLPKTIPLMC